MNKNRFFRSATAAVCAVLCLALLLCITSCFNLSSTQRGNFSFTISEDVVQQIDNALGPRSARNSGVPVITATVTLEKTAGGQLVEPAAKSGILATLINETFTFEDLPLHVPFTVSVSFKADGKEIFSGTSEPITLTSTDATPVAIALKHILDTDIVLPVWDGQNQLGSFRFDQLSKIDAFDPADEDIFSQYCGYEETCFDAYGNIWSIASVYFDENSYLEGCLMYSGSNGMPDVDEEDPLSVFNHGIIRALIPYAGLIECDYSTNSLFVFYQDAETDDIAVLKLSVDELLSIDTEKEIIVLSGIESLDDYWESFSLTDLQNEFTLRSVEPFISGNNGLLTLLYYNQTYPDIEYEPVIEDFDFAVNNGTVYIACEVWDVNMDEDYNVISEKINGFYLVARDPAGTSQLKKLDFNSIFGADTDLRDLKVSDMLFLDGNLYMLVSYRNTTGALVRIDPATLTFSSSDVLGVSKDIKTIPEDPINSGWWIYRTDPIYEEVYAGGYGDYEKDEQGNYYYVDDESGHYNKIHDGCMTLCSSRDENSRCNEGPTNNNLISNDSNGFLGPVKFVAIKPKKLIVADYGFYYEEEFPKSRLLTIDLTNFSIEASETKDLSFDTVDPSDIESVTSITYPFTEGQTLWYSYSGDYYSITFTESMIVNYYDYEDSEDIPLGTIYYWD